MNEQKSEMMTKSIVTRSFPAPQRRSLLVGWLALLVCGALLGVARCQLPDDIQRELNQNLAEQARIQAQRARHQQLMQSRAGAQGKLPAARRGAATGQSSSSAPPPPHDPNNYSYQQVSPPIQYSYYQPYGDLAQPQPQQQPQGRAGGTEASTKPINIDLNNLNFDELPNLPAPQAQTATKRADQSAAAANYQAGQAQQQQPQLTPSFTGAGGLPVLQPVAAANQSPDSFAPAGRPPLAPQAQQGPPLTEADFKDITGGENYGAPGGSDFGMGGSSGLGDTGPERRQSAENNDDSQLREFGMPDNQAGAQQSNRRPSDNPMQSMGLANDFAEFNPMTTGGGARRSGAGNSGAGGADFDPFGGSSGVPFGAAGDFGGMGGGGGGGGGQRRRQPVADGGDFDFASQPSSRSQGDQAQASLDGAAPGSLQSLLGNAFPGLGGGNGGNMGLDGLARGGGGGGQTTESQLDSPQREQRADDGSLDIADLGDRSDGFAGADLGGFEQPTPQNDQDYNYAAAAEQQPRSVPYPDGSPQFVGSLWALTQPQSLTQARYSPLPDKGTYQNYPAYQSGGNDFSAVQSAVSGTARARPAGPGRYGQPSPGELAPEYRELGARMDYSQPPMESLAADNLEANHIGQDQPAAASNSGHHRFF